MTTHDAVRRLRRRPAAFLWAFVRRVYALMVERFARNDILTYASAIALQLLTALIPLALVAFLLLGAFGQQSVWREQLAPRIAGRASVDAYQAIDSVAEGLISGTHVDGLVLGAVIALWEISGAVRLLIEQARSRGRGPLDGLL